MGWSDLIKGGKHELKCGMIINCAGGWVPQIGRIRPGNMAGRLKHRRMLYALFDRPWEAPARFVLAPKRCYLVAPYCGVVFVALMLEETAGPVGPGPASAQDLADLLRMLAHDMPEAGLEATRLYSAWQGSETVSVDVSTRKDLVSSGARCWSYENGMLNLLGGDYGSVSWTVYQGLKQVYRLSGVRDRIVPLNGRLLPGAGLFQESAVEFRRAAAENKVPAQVTERILACLGSRARLISGFDQGWQILPGNLLRGEVELAFELEQAESLEDVVRRRLQVAFLADYDRSVLEGVLKVGSPQRPHLSLKDANYLREIDLSKEKTTAL
ncbi:MAG: hypothetical protein GX589_02440 [Deltaproteobacteria bacterium]|nr:hypothetical protein [Deltaproteobacteria bacterium]